jgi:hypothetical protein
MPARSAPVLLVSLALLAVAGCAATAPASSAPSFTPIAQAPRPTPILSPTFSPEVRPSPTPTPEPIPSAITGDVDGAAAGPELSVEDIDGHTIEVTLDDPAAKAWRVVVAGTAAHAGDRWEIVVDTGDIEPVMSATEVRNDKIVDVLDLTGFGDGTAAVGGCHATLGVCLDSDGFSLPADGDGHFTVRLDLQGASALLEVRGGTASWPSEPFVLGAWTDTEAFPWGA